MIHRKKNRPALQRRDILTVSLVSFFLFFKKKGICFTRSSTQFLARIRSFVNFFGLGSFFGLPVFRGSVLSNLQVRFHLLSSFFRVCS